MKGKIYIILFLVIVWCGFTNNFNFLNIFFGVLISLLILFFQKFNKTNIRINFYHFFILVFYVVWELICSSVEVAWEIITPKKRSQPQFIRLPLRCKEKIQIGFLANLISLTPGTVTIDIDEVRNELIMHIMFKQNEKDIVEFIQNRLEPKIIKAFKYD